MNPSKKNMLWVIFLLIGTAFFVAPRQACASAAPQTRVIKMTAKKFQFDPKVITVNQGDRVELTVTSLDTTHGIQIKGYGINRKLKKGVPTTIEFTANKAGTFPFRCSVWCGMGHRRMKGQLIVKPRS
ncbi:MAG: cupredoxin domain-containing protein [Terriglobia bacterium]